MPNQRVKNDERELVASRLADARAQTDEIFAVLDPEALYQRPIAERHRMVFYLGHVEAFDWNLVAKQAFGVEPFHEAFDRLFAFGIDPTDGGLPNEPPSDWPKRSEIESYNRRVRDIIDSCVRGERRCQPDCDEGTVLGMAVEHRLMHAETLAYLLHRLPHSVKDSRRALTDGVPAHEARRSPGQNPGGGPSRASATRSIPGGRVTLGRSRSENGFGWDNEYERHEISVPDFSMDAHKVSNGRFLEFVREGGYRARTLWSDADWVWKEQHDIRHPGFWIERDGAWLYNGMFAETPLPLDAPVYVSHAEAAAYARWLGRALPSEAQFHRAAYGTPEGTEREYPWGHDEPAARHGNFDFLNWDPVPVGAFPAGDSAFGVSELLGNGWEWTSSLFEPFPGFRAHPFYAGYSANFFDGGHYVMKGGSPRTAASMLRRSFRNWFQPHYPHVYATFRLVGS